MNNNEENWEPCPRCGSKKVEKRGGCFFALIGLSLTGISVFLLIIPPVGILGIIIGIILMFSSIFMKNRLQCQDCKNNWKYPSNQSNSKDNETDKSKNVEEL